MNHLDRYPFLIALVTAGLLLGCGASEPVEPEAEDEAEAEVLLAPLVMSVDFPIEGDGPFDQHRIMDGPTPVLSTLESHFSILQEGKSSHAPHTHRAEEIIFPIQGEVDIYRGPWEDIEEETVRIGPGQFVFHASNHIHGMSAVGPGPSGYWVMQWEGGPTGAEDHILPPSTFDYSTPPAIIEETGVGSEVLAESQTPNAEKVLMQSMAIAPGASLKPAGDSHETVIITLTDGLTIAGEAVDARTVVYRPSDEDFSVENTGDEPAYYISFEYYR